MNNTGYWKGRIRDANTITKLSESKYIKVVQYDEEGNLLKVWDSCKHAAIEIFKDYHIINGSAKSKIYDVLECKLIKNRLAHNSYWFKEKEILTFGFTTIPNKILIDYIYERIKIMKANRRKSRTLPIFAKRYTVEHYDEYGKFIDIYPNTEIAGQKLNLSMHEIQRHCRGIYLHEHFILKYGEKTLQKVKNT